MGPEIAPFSCGRKIVIIEKLCSTCKIIKPKSDFWFRLASKDGLQNSCKDCARQSKKIFYSKNKEAYKKKHSVYNYKRNYNITPEQYNKLFDAQQGQCAICHISADMLNKPLFVDHCHNTLIVRGLLCMSCNMGIGHFKDDIFRLSTALDYLGPFKVQDY